MANEISVTVSLAASKGKINPSLALSFKATLTGANYGLVTQSIPTTAGGVALNISELSTLGFMCIKNNDATNFVTILDAVSGGKIAKIKAGQAMLLPFDPTVVAPAAQADTGAVQVEFLALEI